MKLHRYYVGETELSHSFWMQDANLFHQWTKVLRYEPGREVILFNNSREVRLYRIEKIGNNAVHLELVTQMEPKLPTVKVYLCFALLKKDKNEWILQKGTELGVSHFVPLLSERTEKTGWDSERAHKIIIEAVEQCERADIPTVREPIHLSKVIDELATKVEFFVAEQGSPRLSDNTYQSAQPKAVLIGPEGGWSDEEKQLFQDRDLQHLALSEFTLRAETAAITAAALLQLSK